MALILYIENPVLFLMFLAPLYCYVFPINTYALEPPEIDFDVL